MVLMVLMVLKEPGFSNYLLIPFNTLQPSYDHFHLGLCLQFKPRLELGLYLAYQQQGFHAVAY